MMKHLLNSLTYHLFSKRVNQYKHGYKKDLFHKTFETITKGQIKEFEVDGKVFVWTTTFLVAILPDIRGYAVIQKAFVHPP